MSKKKNYESGKPAEEFYKRIIAPADFNKPLNDERENHIEGDFSIGTVRKYIIEVKGDHICFRDSNPTGNLPIEIKNTANADGEGWFTHCGMDGVDEIVYICYDGVNEHEPVISIRIPFMMLKPYVTAMLNDEEYRRRHYRRVTSWNGETTWNLCIPLKELYEHCGATVAAARMKSPEWQTMAQAALKDMGIDGTAGKYGYISFSEDDRIGGTPR